MNDYLLGSIGVFFTIFVLLRQASWANLITKVVTLLMGIWGVLLYIKGY